MWPCSRSIARGLWRRQAQCLRCPTRRTALGRGRCGRDVRKIEVSIVQAVRRWRSAGRMRSASIVQETSRPTRHLVWSQGHESSIARDVRGSRSGQHEGAIQQRQWRSRTSKSSALGGSREDVVSGGYCCREGKGTSLLILVRKPSITNKLAKVVTRVKEGLEHEFRYVARACRNHAPNNLVLTTPASCHANQPCLGRNAHPIVVPP